MRITLHVVPAPHGVVCVPVSQPLALLRHHVTGAIERGEKEAIVEIPADPWANVRKRS